MQLAPKKSIVSFNNGIITITLKNKKYTATGQEFSLGIHCQRERYLKVANENKDVLFLHLSSKNTRINLVDEFKYSIEANDFNGVANLDYGIDYDEDDSIECYISPNFDQGTLNEFINSKHITDEQEIIEYFRQICYGAMILHQHNITHLFILIPKTYL